NGAASGWQFLCSSGTDLRFVAWRTGSTTDFISAANKLVQDVWTFAAVTFDDAQAGTAKVRLYTGTLAAAVAEVGYASRSGGSGTPKDDSGSNLWAGNMQRV